MITNSLAVLLEILLIDNQIGKNVLLRVKCSSNRMRRQISQLNIQMAQIRPLLSKNRLQIFKPDDSQRLLQSHEE